MITLLIIIMIIAICSTYKKDKKSKKQLAKNEECLSKLPDMYYTANKNNLSSLDKFFISDKDMLEVFQYTSSSRSIYLKMKDGRSISCPLSELDVRFDKVKIFSSVRKVYYAYCKHGSTNFSFYEFPEVFTSKQWEVIFSTLTLAGTTRNVDIMGSAYKNMERANTVLKIIKALS